MSTTPPSGVPPAEPPAGQPWQANQPPAGAEPPTFGQPTSGQPTSGQPTSGQPTSGQPPYGAAQPSYGAAQPSYGAAPTYGAASYGAGADTVGDEPPTTDGGGKRNRAYVPWVIGGAVIALVGGGAFAVQAALGGGGAQPADVLPASTVMYARVDLDPSGAQKIAALRFANKFPSFGDVTGITDPETDLRERFFDELVGSAPELSDLTYEDDIEPWIGSRVGIGLVPVEDGESEESGIILALQVTDEDAAREGLDKLFADDEMTAGLAFSGEYAVFAATQELADGYVADASENPLSADEAFQADMDSLGDPGVASFWLGAEAFDTIAAAEGLDLTEFGGFDFAGMQGSQAMALRFDDRYAEVAYVQRGGQLPPAEDTGENPIVNLPDSTLLAASVSNGDALVDQYWETFTELTDSAGVAFEQELQAFEDATGLVIPDDISTLVGDNFVLGVDGEGLDAIENLQSPADLRIGLLLDTDAAAAQEILDKIVAAAGGGIELETVESDGLLAVSTNADYAAELSSGSLGNSEVFALAVPDAASADMALYFSVDAIEDTSMYSDNVDSEVAENIAPLQAIGVSQVMVDGEIRGTIRVVAGG